MRSFDPLPVTRTWVGEVVSGMNEAGERLAISERRRPRRRPERRMRRSRSGWVDEEAASRTAADWSRVSAFGMGFGERGGCMFEVGDVWMRPRSVHQVEKVWITAYRLATDDAARGTWADVLLSGRCW